MSEIGGALHRARTADGGSERLSAQSLQGTLYPKKGARRQASRQVSPPRHPTKGTTVQKTKGPDPCESVSIRGCRPAERYGSASRTTSLGTEGREARRDLPPLPHPRQQRNPRSRPRSRSGKPSAVSVLARSAANGRGYTQANPIRVPSCPFVVPSLVRVPELVEDQGHNRPKDQGTASV